MKHRIIAIALVLLTLVGFAQSTDATLTTQSNVIRNETTPGANTAARIANMFQALIDSKVNIQQYAKISTTGTANTYAGTVTPAISSYVNGFSIFVKFNLANTGASTINLNGLGAKSIKKNYNAALIADDLKIGKWELLVYDGTNFQLMATSGINYNALSATTPLSYNSSTGVFSIPTWPSNSSGLLKNNGSGTLSWQAESDLSVFVKHDGSVPMTGNLDVDGNQLSNLPDAASNGQAVNYEQWISALDGVKYKTPKCDLATTTNITLSGEQTIDGVSATAGFYVLVKDQTDPSENGIYTVAVGSWSRRSDADTGTELVSALVEIVDGSVNNNTSWLEITRDIILGTSNITWISFGSGVPDATTSTKGKAKLYTSTGSNTDGAMTQSSITSALSGKEDALGYTPEDVANKEVGSVSNDDTLYPASSSVYNELATKQDALTFSTGLTNTSNTITVNTAQNIARLSNLTTNGFVKTGSGNGTLSIDNSTYITGNENITLSGDVSGSGTTAITTAIGSGKVTNTMLAGSIAAGKLVGTDIATVGTITSGTWNGTVIGKAYGGTGEDNSTGGTANTFWARPNGATGAASYRAIVAADIPTLNQNTTGSAATLTTPRAIYGNNFDGSAALTQIIASTYGGTGNGFTKFSGATTSEKTYTLPNASATILTDNAAVTIAQGGTGQTTATNALNALLPSQTGQSGKFLTTDGSSTNWGNVSVAWSGLTGTSTAWLLTGTSTRTGATTISGTTPNGLTFSDVFTTTANNQLAINASGTITLRNTPSDNVSSILVNTAFVSGSTSQAGVGVDINPSWSGANSMYQLGLRVRSGMMSLFGGTTPNTSVSATPSTIVEIQGNNTTDATYPLRLFNNAGAVRFAFTNQSAIILGSATNPPRIDLDNDGGASNSGTALGVQISGNVNSTSNRNILTLSTTGGNIVSNSSIAYKALSIADNVTYAPTSGSTGGFRGVNLEYIINQTGSASQPIYDIYSNATLTGVLGTHYGIAIGSGLNGFGTLTPTARLQAKGAGTTTGELFRLDDSGATNRMLVLDNGLTTFSGSMQYAITSTSTDITLDHTYYTVKVDASGAARTITLPAASGRSGRVYIIKKTDSSGNSVTIDGNASETIDGATTKAVSTQWAGWQIQCDGSNWIIIATF